MRRDDLLWLGRSYEWRESMRAKKKKIIFSLLALLAVVSIGIVYAYFTGSANKNNQFSIGGNEVEIIEEFEPGDETKPGDVFTKKPSVMNTGSVPCYVRAFAEFNDNAVAQCASVDWNNTAWTVKQEDGFYYYKTVLQPGEVTEPLFTQVAISSDADPELVKKFDIIVYAESVQSEGFSNYEEAFYSLIPSE